MKYETATIASLMLDPANVRTHDSKNLESIKASLARFGQQKPIVVNSKGIIVAGNGTMMAAKMLNWSSVEIVRTDLEGAEAIAYAIADNRTAELAGWDEAALAQQLAALQIDDEELANIAGFTDAEIEAMILDGKEIEEDEVPEPPAVPITKAGDLWILGTHRVLCGDSTKAQDVARLMDGANPILMVTDPPYGISLDATWRDGVANGLGRAQKGKLYQDEGFEWGSAIALSNTDVAYVYHHHRLGSVVQEILKSAGYEVKQQIVWVKTVHTLTQSKYQQKHEPCWFAVRKGSSDRWCGGRDQMSAFELASPKHIMGGSTEEKMDHPTQKPIGCSLIPIRNHKGDVYDPFLGSGTTLIAAEQLGRKCYGMEISPAYCDVIVKRWETLTGKTATLST